MTECSAIYFVSHVSRPSLLTLYEFNIINPIMIVMMMIHAYLGCCESFEQDIGEGIIKETYQSESQYYIFQV